MFRECTTIYVVNITFHLDYRTLESHQQVEQTQKVG